MELLWVKAIDLRSNRSKKEEEIMLAKKPPGDKKAAGKPETEEKDLFAIVLKADTAPAIALTPLLRRG